MQEQGVGADVAEDDGVVFPQPGERRREVRLRLVGRHVGEREVAVRQRLGQRVCAAMEGDRGELVEALDVRCGRHPRFARQQYSGTAHAGLLACSPSPRSGQPRRAPGPNASPHFSPRSRPASRPGVRSARSGPKSVSGNTVEARDAAGGRLGATRRAAPSGRQRASRRFPDAPHRGARRSYPVGRTAPRRP